MSEYVQPSNQQIVVGLGELLWDCFADSRRPGGAPTNVAFHAAQLGHHGVVCSRVGVDDLGNELLEYLKAHNLEIRYIQYDEDRPTGYVTVDTTVADRPEYVIHENVAWDHIAFDDRLERLMAKASAVSFGTLAQRSPQSRTTIHRALSAAEHALIVYDVNLRQTWYERDWIERSLRAAHYVKLNSDEVDVLAAVLGTESHDPDRFACALQDRFGVETVCVTRAEKGCLLMGPRDVVDVPGVKVEVVDAVGAGDAFTAALISAHLRGWPLRTAASFANEVGALVANRSGAMPIIKEELAALVRKADQYRDGAAGAPPF